MLTIEVVEDHSMTVYRGMNHMLAVDNDTHVVDAMRAQMVGEKKQIACFDVTALDAATEARLIRCRTRQLDSMRPVNRLHEP